MEGYFMARNNTTNKIALGTWQKLYALVCNTAGKGDKCTWLYNGRRYIYDVSTRDYWPVIADGQHEVVQNG
jgi:hypothetical protein